MSFQWPRTNKVTWPKNQVQINTPIEGSTKECFLRAHSRSDTLRLMASGRNDVSPNALQQPRTINRSSKAAEKEAITQCFRRNS